MSGQCKLGARCVLPVSSSACMLGAQCMLPVRVGVLHTSIASPHVENVCARILNALAPA
jgi:hypothetical protein